MLLRDDDKKEIISLAKKILKQPCKLWAYGSRVNGEAHDTSDLDMVLISKDGSKIDIGNFIAFKEALQNSNIPILTQVLDWHRIPDSFHKNILDNYEEMTIICYRFDEIKDKKIK
ncbi:MAG: nucleotidyltransferase domain-containing protein [Campylobacterota bacterium]|nr:nucleotidyltransferase domain-containing protein [Campylobacterota bacterium]